MELKTFLYQPWVEEFKRIKNECSKYESTLLRLWWHWPLEQKSELQIFRGFLKLSQSLLDWSELGLLNWRESVFLGDLPVWRERQWLGKSSGCRWRCWEPTGCWSTPSWLEIKVFFSLQKEEDSCNSKLKETVFFSIWKRGEFLQKKKVWRERWISVWEPSLKITPPIFSPLCIAA